MGKKRGATEVDLEILSQTFEEWFAAHEKYRNLAGIRKHLNIKYGKGNWGDDEYAQYMMELYDERRENAEAIVREETTPGAPSLFAPDVSAEDRLAQYLEFYEDPAPNDLILLQQMVRIELQLGDMQTQLETSVQDGTRTAAKGWSDMIKTYTAEHRNIQAALGIDRTGRDRSKSQTDLAIYVQDVVQKTSSFLKEHAIKIRCPHCLEAQSSTEIDMGFILFHFRQDVPWSFEFQCPLCEQTVRLP